MFFFKINNNFVHFLGAFFRWDSELSEDSEDEISGSDSDAERRREEKRKEKQRRAEKRKKVDVFLCFLKR